MASKAEKLSRLSHISDLLLTYVHLSKDYERTLKNYGLKEAFGINVELNHMEMHMLAMIHNHPGISAQELAVIFNRTKGAVSQSVKRLTHEGLIIKHENPQNARINNLYTTEIGAVACRNHAAHEAELFENMLPQFESFSLQDLDRVAQIITIFSETLKYPTSIEKTKPV